MNQREIEWLNRHHACLYHWVSLLEFVSVTDKCVWSFYISEELFSNSPSLKSSSLS